MADKTGKRYPNQNRFIADSLREAASILQLQGANRFRVNAYRRAAQSVDSLPDDVGLILQVEGMDGIRSLTGVGPALGDAIAEMARTGRWSQLERLRGALEPEKLFARVAGVGPVLAQHIVDKLHINTLEALEVSAHDGRLLKVDGFGARRLAMVRAGLGEMLKRKGRYVELADEPSVRALLEADREYREKSAAGRLRLIAPRRFNPGHVAWLPVLHTEREGWLMTVLYSNTALAHQLGRTHDWVIIYFHRDSEDEVQRTVVTETQGKLKGRRVVRGREMESSQYYSPVLFPFPSAA
jgi:putative hydrolase